MTVKVVVDAMGSDRAPAPEVAGALRAVRAHDLEVTLVGDEAIRAAARFAERSLPAQLAAALSALG